MALTYTYLTWSIISLILEIKRRLVVVVVVVVVVGRWVNQI